MVVQIIYEHGIFTDEKIGKTRADIHLESRRRDKRSVSYHSNVFSLSPGTLFSMLDHPRPDLAPDALLPDDTRIWAALQDVSGGTWGGAVYDAEQILKTIAAGKEVLNVNKRSKDQETS